MSVRAVVRGRARQAILLAAPIINRHGGFTETMIRKYCSGKGAEIGPGLRPYISGAIMVDKHHKLHGRRIKSDVTADASDLPFQAGELDFLFSAHCLEHHPAPLEVLNEWCRVLKPGGYLFLILPHVDRTFDQGRPVSTYDHHLTAQDAFDEDDPPHWGEYAKWSIRDEPADPAARLADGSWNKKWFVETSSIHYHAWTQHEMAEILLRMALQICVVVEELPDRTDSFAIVARVVDGGYAPITVDTFEVSVRQTPPP